MRKKLKFYEQIDRRSGKRYWWTQRDNKGVYYKIILLPSGFFRLLYNGDVYMGDYGSLQAAIDGAEAVA